MLSSQIHFTKQPMKLHIEKLSESDAEPKKKKKHFRKSSSNDHNKAKTNVSVFWAELAICRRFLHPNLNILQSHLTHLYRNYSCKYRRAHTIKPKCQCSLCLCRAKELLNYCWYSQRKCISHKAKKKKKSQKFWRNWQNHQMSEKIIDFFFVVGEINIKKRNTDTTH